MQVYLDHAATTPLSPAARAAMSPWCGEMFGNPSGPHRHARAARTALDEARDAISEVLGTRPGDLVFTAGGTEAANLAVLGRVAARPGAVVVSAVEHHCVLHAADAANRWFGAEVRTATVDGGGTVDLDALARLLDHDVTLVSVQLVNNETGVLQPLEDVCRLVRRRSPGAVVHTDAVQAAPWFDVAQLAAGTDMVSISAHKFGGPQGAGALAFRRAVEVAPISFGGPQERERRAGTHNVAGAVGMAAALLDVTAGRAEAASRVGGLRDHLRDGLLANVPGSRETAAGRAKAPGHCHLVIDGVESEALLVLLDREGLSASAGASCASGAMGPSHVVTAMGYRAGEALGTLRLTLGHTSTQADVTAALAVVPTAVARLRPTVKRAV